MKNSVLISAATSIFALCAGLTGAQAHATLETGKATGGSFYKAVLRVPHGCDGKATTSVSIKLPEGFVSAQPQPKAGWKTDVVTGDYKQTYKVHGKDVTSGVTEVRWSEGNLPSEFYDEFVVVGTLGKVDKDTTLSFPAVQSCGSDASVEWTEIPAEGQNAHDLKNPAPQLLVLASDAAGEHDHHGGNADAHDHAAAAVQHGDLTISNASIRATVPGAKVGGGYLIISNDGKEADRLTGASSPSAERVEIHEMSMDNQVMKMRQIKEGVEIPAGEKIEFKSGGYHLMLMKPAKPYVEGESVPVTLEFEKAGKVEVTFAVSSASGKPSEHANH